MPVAESAEKPLVMITSEIQSYSVARILTADGIHVPGKCVSQTAYYSSFNGEVLHATGGGFEVRAT